MASKTDHHVILRVVAKPLIPIIALFALYVQFHGDYSPGGGFQAGVIIAVAIILYSLIFGIAPAMRAVPPAFARGLAGVGFLLFAGVGVWALMMGGNFLDYDALHPDQSHHAGQHYGILLVELGVLITVTSVMLAIFYAFAGRVPDIPDEEW